MHNGPRIVNGVRCGAFEGALALRVEQCLAAVICCGQYSACILGLIGSCGSQCRGHTLA